MRKPQFKRLEYLYYVALGCIALSIIVSQFFIQTSIDRQQDDARVINVAGRQRMLSQKISKLALKLQQVHEQEAQSRTELEEALNLWIQSHEGLLKGDSTLGLEGQNSAAILSMFDVIESPFQIISKSASILLDVEATDSAKALACQEILAHEASFLTGMNEIVFRYDSEAQAKVSELKQKEYILFFISILIISFELAFVFRPIARNVQKTVVDLQKSEEASKQMTAELTDLYEELGKSYQDLEAVNFEPESPSIYAKMDFQGNFSFHSALFLKLMEYEAEPASNITEILQNSGYDPVFINGLLELLSQKKNWIGELKLINEAGDFCWLETFLVPVPATNEIKMVARDLTENKEAKMRSREINRERIEKSVKEHQFRSSLILQGQEEERKRISQELHDGVGQMMSALKMMLESILPTSSPMKNRLKDAKSLTKSIIQEVRRVSFNLTPSSLDDFGLVPAVRKFCEEINGVTDAAITFTNETRFINRLESSIETNLYRIVQEAVNNAIKYARAKEINVIFHHNLNSLQIVIEDNGRGFDVNSLEQSGHFEKAGHGIFNMKERTAYVGGNFQLVTEPEKGTKIYITLALNNND